MAKNYQQDQSLSALKAALHDGSFHKLYIFHGEEPFLLRHYLQQLKNALIDPLTESFNYHKLTAETFDPQSFAEAVENLPMMAEHTFVWVDEIDLFKLSESDRNFIAALLEDIPDYCCVVFTYETTPWKPDKRLKKLYDAIERNASIVNFERQQQRDLITWVTRHFASQKKQITPELCSYLIDLTGGSMTLLSEEIKKICAFSDAQVIVKSDIDAVTEPVLDAVVFQMTDLMGKGDYGAAMIKLQQLMKMQTEPLSVLGSIGSHFRRISTARILMDNGKGVADFTEIYPTIRGYAAEKTFTSAKRFSADYCACACQLVVQTDHQIKTSFDDPQRLLELLVLRLAQEARRG